MPRPTLSRDRSLQVVRKPLTEDLGTNSPSKGKSVILTSVSHSPFLYWRKMPFPYPLLEPAPGFRLNSFFFTFFFPLDGLAPVGTSILALQILTCDIRTHPSRRNRTERRKIKVDGGGKEPRSPRKYDHLSFLNRGSAEDKI